MVKEKFYSEKGNCMRKRQLRDIDNTTKNIL